MEVNIPVHVGIIMDGNGRWAQKRGLKRTFGHKKGAETLKKIAKYAFEKGVKVLSVYAFSTENWNRSEDEVNFLMDLFLKNFNKSFNDLKKNNIKIVFSGLRDRLNSDVLQAMDKVTEETKNNNGGIFNICLNYGGKDEIINATKNICKDLMNNKLTINDINKESYSKYLFNNLPDIDLLIRTSNEHRISNFMLWQIAYSELYFTEVLWPDFNKREFDKALKEYKNRDRRFGKVKSK